MNDLDWIQWPAMAITVAAAWFVASQSETRRAVGFWVFLASNGVWIAWGWQAQAWALVTLQVCLAVMNIRGAWKNERDDKPTPHASPVGEQP